MTHDVGLRVNFIRVIFLVAASFFLAVHAWFTEQLLTVSLLASSIIGLAHGGLDWPLAKLWGLRATIWQSLYFAIAYSGCILLTCVLWLYLPLIALLIFLLMSWVHFARDWRAELSRMDTYVLAAVLLCVPTINFYLDVEKIFTLLLSRSDASLLIEPMVYIAYLSVCILLLKLIYWVCARQQGWIVLEVTTLIGLALVLHPIIYFSVYFCFLHAPKHWQVMRQLGVYHHLPEGLYKALWPTGCCVLIGGVVTYYVGAAVSFDDALSKTLFIGLAVLTVPHWLLVEIYGDYVSYINR